MMRLSGIFPNCRCHFGPCAQSRRPGFFLRLALTATALSLPFTSCTKKLETPAAAPLVGEALILRGKTVYQGYCIACHNPDPSKPGAVGPDLAGSSLELLEGRVLSLKYPDGYRPKRGTALMAPMPYLKKDLGALHAF